MRATRAISAPPLPTGEVERLDPAELIPARPHRATEVIGLDRHTSRVVADRYDNADTDVPITRSDVEPLLDRNVALLARAHSRDPDRAA